jgi:hypothetical protein
MTVETLRKIDEMNLEKKDVSKVKEKVLDSFTKLMAIGIAQKIYDTKLEQIQSKKNEELRKQYDPRS